MFASSCQNLKPDRAAVVATVMYTAGTSGEVQRDVNEA